MGLVNEWPGGMVKYEYIRLYFDFGDLSELNSLGSTGWKVVAVQREGHQRVALLMREWKGK